QVRHELSALLRINRKAELRGSKLEPLAQNCRIRGRQSHLASFRRRAEPVDHLLRRPAGDPSEGAQATMKWPRVSPRRFATPAPAWTASADSASGAPRGSAPEPSNSRNQLGAVGSRAQLPAERHPPAARYSQRI